VGNGRFSIARDGVAVARVKSFLERVGADSGSAGVVGAMGAGVFHFFMTAEPFGCRFGFIAAPVGRLPPHPTPRINASYRSVTAGGPAIG